MEHSDSITFFCSLCFIIVRHLELDEPRPQNEKVSSEGKCFKQFMAIIATLLQIRIRCPHSTPCRLDPFVGNLKYVKNRLVAIERMFENSDTILFDQKNSIVSELTLNNYA